MLATPEIDGAGIGTVLILEDEALVSFMIEDIVRDLGASEVIVCRSPGHAQAVIHQHSVHCAILDVRIGGADSFELADELANRQVPFFFATASGPEVIVERHRHRPILDKPFSDTQLLELLSATLHGREPG